MKPYPTCSDRIFDCCNVSLRLFWKSIPLETVISAFVLLLLLTSQNIFAQYTCADYCNQGYTYWVVTDSNYFCFSVSTGDSDKVCLEVELQWVGGGNCDPNATVLVGVYPLQQNCTSPLEYSFTAGNSIKITPCPNGTGVHCCCLPPGNYYMRILSGGADYSQCFIGHVKACLNCSHGNCP